MLVEDRAPSQGKTVLSKTAWGPFWLFVSPFHLAQGSTRPSNSNWTTSKMLSKTTRRRQASRNRREVPVLAADLWPHPPGTRLQIPSWTRVG
jgi:hypothetical protein